MANSKTEKPKKEFVDGNAGADDGCEDACSMPGPARGGYKDDTYDSEVFAALSEEDERPDPKKEIKEIQDILPKHLTIRDRCLQLGYMIGPITQKEGKEPFEVGGFFTVVKGDPSFKYTDFIVPKKLPVTPGSIEIAEHYPRTAEELKAINEARGTNLRLGAMFHIHTAQGKEGLGHSGPDDDALVRLVNRMAKTTRQVFNVEYRLIEGKVKREYGSDHFALTGHALSDAIVKLYYPDDQVFFELLRQFGFKPNQRQFKKNEFLARLLDSIDHTTEEPRAVSFATSFVFNNGRGGPYIKVEIEDKLMVSQKVKRYIWEQPPYKVVDKGIDLPTEEGVLNLVKGRVVFPPKPKVIRWFGGGRRRRSFAVPGYRGDGHGNAYYPGKQGFDGTWEDQGLPTGPGHDFNGTPETKYPTKGNKVRKLAEGAERSIESLANLFALESEAYVMEFMNPTCKYSTFMAEVIDRLGEFSHATVATFDYGRQVPNAPAQSDKGDLRAIVLSVGDLKEDGDSVEKPEFLPYRLRNVVENLVEYHKKDDDPRTRLFMLQFVNARDIVIRNQVIEEYVKAVKEEYEKAKKAVEDERLKTRFVKAEVVKNIAGIPEEKGGAEEDGTD